MIHFDFVVDDVDAENILDAIYQMELQAKERIANVEWVPITKELPESHKAWWESHAKYCGELLLKMKNTKIPNKNEHNQS